MPRLNNKDYTVEELERLIYLTNNLIHRNLEGVTEIVMDSEDRVELEELIKGSQFTNFEEGERKPNPIPWNMRYEFIFMPDSFEQAELIKNAMRSAEVNDNIKRRHRLMIYEEVNWYKDRVKIFMTKGDTNVLE